MEIFRLFCRSHRQLRKQVRYGEGCENYEEWRAKAHLLDVLDGREAWKAQDESDLYNWRMARALRDELCGVILAMEREWGAQQEARLAIIAQVRLQYGAAVWSAEDASAHTHADAADTEPLSNTRATSSTATASSGAPRQSATSVGPPEGGLYVGAVVSVCGVRVRAVGPDVYEVFCPARSTHDHADTAGSSQSSQAEVLPSAQSHTRSHVPTRTRSRSRARSRARARVSAATSADKDVDNGVDMSTGTGTGAGVGDGVAVGAVPKGGSEWGAAANADAGEGEQGEWVRVVWVAPELADVGDGGALSACACALYLGWPGYAPQRGAGGVVGDAWKNREGGWPERGEEVEEEEVQVGEDLRFGDVSVAEDVNSGVLSRKGEEEEEEAGEAKEEEEEEGKQRPRLRHSRRLAAHHTDSVPTSPESPSHRSPSRHHSTSPQPLSPELPAASIHLSRPLPLQPTATPTRATRARHPAHRYWRDMRVRVRAFYRSEAAAAAARQAGRVRSPVARVYAGEDVDVAVEGYGVSEDAEVAGASDVHHMWVYDSDSDSDMEAEEEATATAGEAGGTSSVDGSNSNRGSSADGRVNSLSGLIDARTVALATTAHCDATALQHTHAHAHAHTHTHTHAHRMHKWPFTAPPLAPPASSTLSGATLLARAEELLTVAVDDNLAGTNNPQLYSHTNTGTKYLIASLSAHVARCIDLLALCPYLDPHAEDANGAMPAHLRSYSFAPVHAGACGAHTHTHTHSRAFASGAAPRRAAASLSPTLPSPPLPGRALPHPYTASGPVPPFMARRPATAAAAAGGGDGVKSTEDSGSGNTHALANGGTAHPQRPPLAPLRSRPSPFAALSNLHGHTALCLSGGAGLGVTHCGVLTALATQGALPHIIAGTSAGSLFAALACTRTTEQLLRDLQPATLQPLLGFDNGLTPAAIAASVLRHGVAFDPALWLQLLRWYCNGDMTFREAYALTGRVLVVTATTSHPAQSPLLLSYLTAPDVVVWSAVVASASVPLLLPPVTLVKKVVGDAGAAHTHTQLNGSGSAASKPAADASAATGMGTGTGMGAGMGVGAGASAALEKRDGKLWHNGAEVVDIQVQAPSAPAASTSSTSTSASASAPAPASAATSSPAQPAAVNAASDVAAATTTTATATTAGTATAAAPSTSSGLTALISQALTRDGDQRPLTQVLAAKLTSSLTQAIAPSGMAEQPLSTVLAHKLADALAPSGVGALEQIERAVEASQTAAHAHADEAEAAPAASADTYADTRGGSAAGTATDAPVGGATGAVTAAHAPPPCHLEHVSICGWGVGLRDGSIQSDIPVDVLRYRHNARVCVAVQVNPHVAPFMYSARGDSGRRRARWSGWRGGYITCVLESLLRGGMYSNLNTLRELSMVPVVLGIDVTQIWTQGVGGDITITADVGLSDITTIFNTPSEREVERKRVKGLIMVWTHLARLEQRMRIGRALQRARERMNKHIAADHCDATGW